ncbi:MAG: hypothetical protein E7624_02625 [Ruminococcaceae bacterium]|nr:hypothetical protein [Oscillospiraceae bacterium]
MKKNGILALFLCLAMLFSFAACQTPPADNGDNADQNGSAQNLKMQAALVSTANFKVTAAMMSYMVYTEYQNLVRMYQQYSQQVGFSIPIYGGEGGSALDTNKSLRQQTYATKDEAGNTLATPITWFDHFAELALADVKQMLVLCEGARAEGMQMTDEDKKSVDAAIENIAKYAEYYGYTTDGYIAALYGEGVVEADVRAIMELSYLATKYNDSFSKELWESVTDGMIVEEYEAHNFGDEDNKYDTFVDYVSYTIEATFTPSKQTDKELAAVENQALAADYETRKARYSAMCKELEKCETPEQFADKLLSLLRDFYVEDGATPEEAEKEALEELASISHSNVNVSASTTDVEFRDWVTDKETPRAAGDVFRDVSEYDAFGEVGGTSEADATEKEYRKSTSTYTVYLLKSGLHRDESVLRSVGHILFKTDTYKDKTTLTGLVGPVKTLAERVLRRAGVLSAKEMAAELFLLMQEEGKLTAHTEGDVTYYTIDKAVFEAYGKQYTEDGNVFYEDVYVGQMVATFENWLFDPARVVGEISEPAVESPYGYHTMFYVGNEKPVWKDTVRSALAEQAYGAMMEQMEAGTDFTYGEDSLYDLIAG